MATRSLRIATALLLASVFTLAALPARAAETEAELRSRLGVPAEAKSVLVFSQSSHVDPDWLLTADQYQRVATDKAFDGALVELARDPRYVYSVECIFFFRRYYDDHPELQLKLRDYVNTGRIRFSGVGVTTPDTLLPEAENILRDYLIGWNWLKKNGMNVDPRIAYFPDDFGHSPTVPTMLAALGLKYAVMTRVDGTYMAAADWAPAKNFPMPGSSYELLFRKLNTADFVWEGPDGSRVLAHVTPTFYDMGDLIAHTDGAAMMGIYLALPAEKPTQTNAKIDRYIAKLKPYAPTGYMWVPIGGDFMPPVKNPLAYIDEYNRTRYPLTGTYAVLAAVEDYMDLVSFHQDQLPTLKFDPNPYWTGFYSSRPHMKSLCRDLSRSLFLAEAAGVAAEDRGTGKYPDLWEPWYVSAMSNHHDFITGTARDEVLKNEQLPLLREAIDFTRKLIPEISPESSDENEKLTITEDGDLIAVENRYYLIAIDKGKGGTITRWLDKTTAEEIVTGPSNEVVLYQDSGGMYLMGMEVYKGIWKEILSTGGKPIGKLKVTRSPTGMATVEVSRVLSPTTRAIQTMNFRADSPVVHMSLTGRVGGSKTMTVRFRTTAKPGRFVQNLTYGVVERPVERHYKPTFWAVKDWVELIDQSGKFGVNLAVTAPGSVSARADGTIEAVALRNARAERTMGFIPAFQTIVANGKDPSVHGFEYAVWSHGAEPWLERRPWERIQDSINRDEGIFDQLVKLDRPDVVVTAIKKSEAGDGVVVRLFRYAPGPVTVALAWNGKPVKSATLVDAMEREIGPLPVADGKVTVEMPYALASALLKF